MIGGYILELLAYGVHHRGVQLVDTIEYILIKHIGKDRVHGTHF